MTKIEAFLAPADALKSCLPNLFECFKVDYSLINEQLPMAFKGIVGKLNKTLESTLSKLQTPTSQLEYLSEHECLIPFSVYKQDELFTLIGKSGLDHNSNYFMPIMIANHLFIKYAQPEVVDVEMLDNEQVDFIQEIIDENDYIGHIRPDMLQLYKFVNDWKTTPQEQPMILICGSKKIQLNNKRNWIFKAINDYLAEHLRVGSVEDAEDELISKYAKKTGRKSNKFQTLIINGIDKIYQKATNSEEITNQQCQFIRDYLKHLGIPISDDEFDHEDDIKNIRSRIRYLRKTGCLEEWITNKDQIIERPICYGW